MADKAIVSNVSALRAKYGTAGLAKLRAAVRRLIAADRKRGLTTVFIPIDDATAMKKLGAPVVTKATNQRQNKAAIDGVYAALTPDYVMILGSVDVVPHQDLVNLVFDPANPLDDPDRVVPSDLPYACQAPWSTEPKDFIAPSRVVGRLPDVTGSKNPAYLLTLLSHAIKPVSSPAAKITAFGLTAQAWQVSTDKSLRTLFGTGTSSQTSPTSGPNWAAVYLDNLVHFINCHGDKKKPEFYGEPNNYPIAHNAAWITKKIRAGTVAAAECCYGAELYRPAGTSGQICIGNTYLECGSTAYFGSTTIAYGPAATNEYADVICRLFLEEIMKGRSSGDAALTARLRYAKVSKPIDTVDLKTLSQFILLGDPSIHPVRIAKTKPAAGAKSMARMFAAPFRTSSTARAERREESREDAAVLEVTAPVASEPSDASEDIVSMIKGHASQIGMTDVAVRSYTTRVGIPSNSRSLSAAPSAKLKRATAAARKAPSNGERVHVALGKRPQSGANDRLNYPVAIVAKQRPGEDIQLTTIYGKVQASRSDRDGQETPRRRRVEKRARSRRTGE